MNIVVSTPIGNQTITVPVEQIAAAAAQAAWPPLRSQIEAEVPVLVNKAWPLVQSKAEQVLPTLLAKAMPTVQAEEKAIIGQVDKAVFLLGAAVVAAVGVGVWALRRR